MLAIRLINTKSSNEMKGIVGYIIISLIISQFMLTSCNEHKVQTATLGLWSIDSITYKGVNLRACFDINTIHFDEDAVCTVPELISADCGVTTEHVTKNGSWSITEKFPLIVNMNVDNDIFNGKYEVRFIDDSVRKLLVMELISMNTFIRCRKGLTNYDESATLIQKLVRISKE